MSLALPLIATGCPSPKVAPTRGVAIVDTGGVVSVDLLAGTNGGACNVAGCTPISASKFTIACWMSGSVGVGCPS